MLIAELKSVGGTHDGKVIPLEVDRKFLIGREQDCHLRPNSEAVSRHHCCFTLDSFCLRLRDLGSTNGTLVNGEQISGQVRLQAGDQVVVGPLEFVVLLRDSGEAPEAVDEPVEATAEAPAGDSADVLDDINQEPSSSDTLIDLPVDAA
ncbi:MAG: FHA domain-containing protein, partial [Planctomycetaceae bacterium]